MRERDKDITYATEGMVTKVQKIYFLGAIKLKQNRILEIFKTAPEMQLSN